MPDIYVDLGPMAFSKDINKVAQKYTANAKKLMRDAAVKAIRNAPGFTPDNVANASGYHVDATLAEIAFGTHGGQPAVTCKMTGVVATYPQKKWLTSTLKGKATIAGDTSDGAVADCIAEAMKATMTDVVIPYLKQKP